VRAHVEDPNVDHNQAVTLLHVRKWVQVLQGRSLVLGHVDKPMVHDLVRDFCMAQFSPETQALVREQQIGGSGGSLEPPGPLLEPPGPLLTYLRTVYKFMAYSERLHTR
jgi:hypothetical protein